MINRTIVGWDGSEEARVALDWAVSREVPRDGTVDLVRVVDPATVSTDYGELQAVISEAHKATNGRAERLSHEYPSLTVNVHVVVGDPREELLRFTGADALLIVGTEKRHGRRGKYRWSLGALIAAQSSYLVAVVPPLGDVHRQGIVVGFDGSALSEKAVEVAAFEAERSGEELTIVHAWQEPMVDQRFLADDEFIVSLAERHRDLLEAEADRLRARHPRLQINSSLDREAATQALLAAGRTAAMLVIGNPQVGAIGRVLLSSVSHSLILSLDAPLMLVGSDAPGVDALSITETGTVKVSA